MSAILVVDDSKVMREMVIACLRALPGSHFTQASSGLEAIERLSLNNYAAMVLDLNMPEIDGFGFLDTFRSLPKKIVDKSKIVVLTSSNSAKDREQAFAFSNVVQFITKPLKQSDIDDLKKLLSKN